MNKRIIAVFLVFLMLSCSVCTGIVFAHDKQEKNRSSHNQPHFELRLFVYTYARIPQIKNAIHPMYFFNYYTDGNYTAQVFYSKTNELIKPSNYLFNGTVWNLTMNEYYTLILSKEGYITQTYQRLTDEENSDYRIINAVMFKKTAPLFLRLLGWRINFVIFDDIARFYWFLLNEPIMKNKSL